MSPLPVAAVPALLGRSRWFGGKGRDFEVVSVRRVGQIPTTAQPQVVIDLAEVRYSDGSVEVYQLPLALYPSEQVGLAQALVSRCDDGVFAYDAVQDPAAMSAWLAAFTSEPGAPARVRLSTPAARTAPGESDATNAVEHLQWHRVDGYGGGSDDATPRLFAGEQSNSSVIFGRDCLLKVFRKVTAGMNPDIEIHDVLTRAGSEHIASLYGWLSVGAPEPLQLALLQQFLADATDGWDLALAAVRARLAQVREDFAVDAAALGAALGQVHATLAATFGTSTVAGAELTALSQRMVARLAAAVAVVPELVPHQARLAATFAAVAGLESVTVQRVHGDLHLGQTLRTPDGWRVVDFEGEPAKTLPERVLPDSPWRDVAGMLRSFDYAAHSVLMAGGEDAAVARAWTAQNSAAFLAGYLAGRELTAAESVLLPAYVADKAVYEAVYEARNRPAWLPIPLAALAAG